MVAVIAVAVTAVIVADHRPVNGGAMPVAVMARPVGYLLVKCGTVHRCLRGASRPVVKPGKGGYCFGSLLLKSVKGF